MRIKSIIISIVAFIYVLSPFVSANATSSYSKGYEVWKPTKTEIVNKTELKLSLSKKLSKTTEAYITDQTNKKIMGKYKVNLSKYKNSITISPNTIFTPGKSYRIYIKNAVSLSKGKYKSIVLSFDFPKPKEISYIKNINIKTANDKIIFTVQLATNVSKLSLETEKKTWTAKNNKGTAVISLSNIKGGNKYTLSTFDSAGKQLQKKEGTTPKLPVVQKDYLKEVDFHYNSLITNALIHTTADVYKVTVEYNGFTFEAHYNGSQTFDIGLQNATLGSKIKIKAYDDRDKLLQSKDIVITSDSKDDSSDNGGEVPVTESTIQDVKVQYSSVLTNFTVKTNEKTFRVVVEGNSQKYETHYSGSNTYDIGIPNMKKGEKVNILAYDESDKLIESKEVSVN